MSIVDRLLGFTLFGAEWVLWLLLALSVISIAVIIERCWYFYTLRINYADFSKNLSSALEKHDIEQAKEVCGKEQALAAKVALHGLEDFNKSATVTEGSMDGFIVGQKQQLDRGLVVLGTLGNNAPFIGLFGTVIGIVVAFNKLASNPEGGPSVIMAEISEALVATAVGLFVAIPAVIAYNFFNRIVKGHMAHAQSTIKLLMTYHK